jgi:hypothetical protein
MAVDVEILKTLCDFDGHEYISKKGEAYLNALSKVFPLDNINDNPFTIKDILQQPELSDFRFPGLLDYKFICKLKVRPMTISLNNRRKNEKIFPEDFANEEAKMIFNQSLGVSYLLTCPYQGKEYIIKIGSSRTTFKQRLGSYNCGVVNNWRTASTTNIKILQSMVTNRIILNLYLFDCSQDLYVIDWHGIRSVPFASPKALAVEDIMIKQFIEQFGKKPLANVQASATEVD